MWEWTSSWERGDDRPEMVATSSSISSPAGSSSSSSWWTESRGDIKCFISDLKSGGVRKYLRVLKWLAESRGVTEWEKAYPLWRFW